MQIDECNLPNLNIYVLLCSDSMNVWCRNYSQILLRVPDEGRAAADEWRGGLEVRRRGEESGGCGCWEE